MYIENCELKIFELYEFIGKNNKFAFKKVFLKNHLMTLSFCAFIKFW